MRRLLLLPLAALLVVAACGSTTTSPAPAGSPSAAASTAPGSTAPSASTDATAAPTATSSPQASASASSDPDAEPTAPANDTGAIPSDAATPQPSVAAGSPTPEPRTACQKLNDAIDTVDLYLQFFTQADETTWEDMTGPESPIEFDRAKFTKAIALLRQDPAMKNAAPLLRSLDKTLGQALESDAPFASTSSPGSILVRAATKNFIQIEEALVAVRTAQGCG